MPKVIQVARSSRIWAQLYCPHCCCSAKTKQNWEHLPPLGAGFPSETDQGVGTGQGGFWFLRALQDEGRGGNGGLVVTQIAGRRAKSTWWDTGHTQTYPYFVSSWVPGCLAASVKWSPCNGSTKGQDWGTRAPAGSMRAWQERGRSLNWLQLMG